MSSLSRSSDPETPPAARATPAPGAAWSTAGGWPIDRLAWHYARVALGAAFLSAVAARFGLWHGRFDLAEFDRFLLFTAQVNSFMPPAAIPFLAWAATVAETTFGVALIAGIQVRRAAYGSALLLALFATAMAISEGIKWPMDYSVYSASAGALLLARCDPRRTDARARRA